VYSEEGQNEASEIKSENWNVRVELVVCKGIPGGAWKENPINYTNYTTQNSTHTWLHNHTCSLTQML
jgi:hypothetical protein